MTRNDFQIDDRGDDPGYDDSDAVEMYMALAAQERRVLNLLVAHRRIAAPIAKAAGLVMQHFEQDDHRLIFAGWLVACEDNLPLIDMLRLVRRGLREAGLWDPTVLGGSDGLMHSDATLAALGTCSLTKGEYLDSMSAVGEDGDWLSYAIARHVAALVGAVEMIGGAS